MAPHNFADLTRDLIRSVNTVGFTLQAPHQRTAGVFTVTGQATYKDRGGNLRSVYISFVLQDFAGT